MKRLLLEEEDPIQRIALALPSLNDELITATVMDSIAAISAAERLILSSRLFPGLVENFPEVSAIVLETLATDLADIESLFKHNDLVLTRSNRYKASQEINKICASLGDEEAWIEDILWTAFKRELDDDPLVLLSRAREIAQILHSVEWRKHA